MSYLEEKGHSPVKHLTGGRLSYLCPLPWHSESKPSFVVWTNAEYENFYCFGCLSKHNIIHLVSFLESITVKEAIELLSDGMEFSIADEEKLAQNQLASTIDATLNTVASGPDELSQSLIDISMVCQTFLRGVDHAPEECDRIDHVWEMVDKSLLDYDLEKIESIRRELKPLLLKQRQVLAHKKEQKKKQELSG